MFAARTSATVGRRYASSVSSKAGTISKKTPTWSMKAMTGIALASGVGVLTATTLYYRNPQSQAPFEFDETKKTIVVLGSGWSAVSAVATMDTNAYNLVWVSPRNYFLFTPLLPSTTVGTVELRSIMQPIRFFTRHLARDVLFVEATCTDVDPDLKIVTVESTASKAGATIQQIKYDYLVVSVGAQNATFGIPGVAENAFFLKEASDARKIRTQLLDCLESATFPGQSQEEIDRLLHMVVVGSGPTGVEYAAELHDFLHDDLSKWYPELAKRFKITLVSHSPHLLTGFSEDIIHYSEEVMSSNKVEFVSNTGVKQVSKTSILVEHADKTTEEIPAGLIVWAAGNGPRSLTKSLIAKLPKDSQNSRRGLVIDDWMVVKGSRGFIFALGDCTSTRWAQTAQVASKQGAFLARQFRQLQSLEEERYKYVMVNGGEDGFVQQRLRPFKYEHQGALAYVGGDKAVADLPGVHLFGQSTYYFWRSVYLSEIFSLRNRVLVGFDWVKCKIFGRDISRE
ncbi:pyridine nucleotide-disulfide oxidoreductase-domain-containing protein [Chytriomyces sp. MP71]|nr:pyridine nucleotide-disulfide oxidoreductase-domain-containing protein [Chytriomyces sp. MP71]